MNLSGGNQQKVVIAITMVGQTNPKVSFKRWKAYQRHHIGSKAAVHEFMSELVDSVYR